MLGAEFTLSHKQYGYLTYLQGNRAIVNTVKVNFAAYLVACLPSRMHGNFLYKQGCFIWE